MFLSLQAEMQETVLLGKLAASILPDTFRLITQNDSDSLLPVLTTTRAETAVILLLNMKAVPG